MERTISDLPRGYPRQMPPMHAAGSVLDLTHTDIENAARAGASGIAKSGVARRAT
jgi:hypothetical protein